MKQRKRLATMILAWILSITMTVLPVYAATATQDGLELNVSTDRSSYSESDKITTTVTARNTEDREKTNLNLELQIPAGFQLAAGSDAVTEIDTLAPGAIKSHEIVLEKTDSSGTSGETDDPVRPTTTPKPTTTPRPTTVPRPTTTPRPTSTPGSSTPRPGSTSGTNSSRPGNNTNTAKPGTTKNSNSKIIYANNQNSGNNNAQNASNTTNSGKKGWLTGNVNTGDHNLIILWVLVFVAAAVIMAVVIGVKVQNDKKRRRNRRRRDTYLSLLLVLTMAASITSVTGVKTYAATTNSLSASATVKVGTEKLVLTAVLTYDLEAAVLPAGDGDSDGDHLLDEFEAEYGTDPLNPDTDGDGLSDYEEILLGTDPLVAEEYDPDADSDDDGLTDLEELHDSNTDPFSADTDHDGLSDFEEVKTYGTDPLEEDTDGDTLSDGFEVEHGLDPKNLCSDGHTPDAEVSLEQTITEDSISDVLLDPANEAKPALDGAFSGELGDYIFLGSSGDSAFDENRNVVGHAVYVDGDDALVNGLTLSFDLSTYGGNVADLVICSLNEDGNYELTDCYADGSTLSTNLNCGGNYCVLNCGEFLNSLGIDLTATAASVPDYYGEELEEVYIDAPDVDVNGLILDEVNRLEEEGEEVPMELNEPEEIDKLITAAEEEAFETEGEDVETAEAYDGAMENDEAAETTDESVPYEAEVDEIQLEELNEVNADIAYAAETAPSTVSGQADIVFAIDTTGSMSSTINNVVTNVTSFVTTLAENYNVKVNFGLVDFRDLEADGPDSTIVVKNGSSNWYSNVGTFANAVHTLRAAGGGDDPECAVDALEAARRMDFRSSANKFVILITDTVYKETNNYGVASMEEEIERLQADGIVTSVVSRTSAQGTYQNLYETTGGIFADISNSSFSTSLMALADMIGERTSDGEWVILKHGYKYIKLTDEEDQDEDGIPTIEELGVAEEIDLTPLIAWFLSQNGVPISDYAGQRTVTVYNGPSNPDCADSDSDGIMDPEDTAPWTTGLSGGIVGGLKICSYLDNPEASSASFAGHAYLGYTNYISSTLHLYGMEVTSADTTAKRRNYEGESPSDHTVWVASGDFISLGSWADFVPKKCRGCFINQEKFLFEDRAVHGQTSLARYITYSQLEKLQSSSKKYSDWDYLTNCSYFASKVWNETVDDNLSARVVWCCPKDLSQHMQERGGYEFEGNMYTEWP